MMALGYKPRKAAQVVAYLIQGRGGRTDIIDVIKLAYLSDREFLDRYDRPILFDDLFCFDHGPVDSQTYDSIKSEGKLEPPWSDYLDPRRGHGIALTRRLSREDFDELSIAEERVMDDVLDEHRHRKGFALVDWIHKNCREWSNPRGTSVPLPYFEVWKALGRTDCDKMDKHINELRNMANSLED
jgi:uncharacterized phage-associated protein